MKDSPRPLASAEMALIRLGYAADLPAPEDALRKLAETADAAPRIAPQAPQSAPPRGSSGGSALRAVARFAPSPVAQPRPRRRAARAGVRLARFEDVVALARTKRDIQLQAALENDVRPVRFEAGRIEFSLVEGASPQIAQSLSRRLQEWTGERWMVTLAAGSKAPTLRESAEAREAERLSGVAANPLVRKVLERFPGAEIVEVRRPEARPSSARLPCPARRMMKSPTPTQIYTSKTTSEVQEPSMKDIMGLMKQAQAMQSRMQELQGELDQIEVEGQSGGGLVRVTLSAKGAMKAVAIDPSLLKPEEKEIVEDLILAAHADARAKKPITWPKKNAK